MDVLSLQRVNEWMRDRSCYSEKRLIMGNHLIPPLTSVCRFSTVTFAKNYLTPVK